MKVKHKLLVLMAIKGIRSISELSRITGVDYATLNNFKNYIHKKLDPQLIVILCKTLDCDISDLLYLEKGDSNEGVDKATSFGHAK